MHIKSIYGRFTTRAVAITFVVALAAGRWIYGQESPAPTPYPAEKPGNRGLDATLYMQTAAEYRASCYQTYKWAAIRLEALIKERTATGIPAKHFAVIMDLDETVLDNSRFQAMLLQQKLAWHKDLWKVWERDHSEDLTLIPGAGEFIEKIAAIAKELKWPGEVFFVSNRNGKDFKQQALDALTRLGVVTDAVHLKLIPDPAAEDNQNKTARFDDVRAHYEVLLYVGDNLRDFSEELAFDKLGFGKVKELPEEKLADVIKARQDKVDGQAGQTPVRDRLGNDWIILPNPTYGDWKAPLGRGEIDFNRLNAAVFPTPPGFLTASASPTPESAQKDCSSPSNNPHKKCTSSRRGVHGIDPAIWVAVITLLSTAAGFFWRKHLERRSINRAILAEIERILTVAKEHLGWLSRQKDTNHPLIPLSHPVYSKQVANIGALTNRLVARAVTFYGYVGFINSLQAARPEYLATGKGAEFKEMYLQTLRTFLEKYQYAFDRDFGGL